MRAICCFAVISLIAPATVALSDDALDLSTPVVQGPIGNRMHDYLRSAEQFGFSGVALVAMDGKVVLHQPYGLADRENRKPNRLDTVFSFGSIAKQFTAAAIMKLEQEGRLSTADRITKFFDDVPSDKADITIHQLLTHSSGLGDYHGVHDFQKMSRDEATRRIFKNRLIGEPSQRFAYSNSGYTLAGAIVEKVTGRNYVEYMKEEIFKPAGMVEAGFMGEKIWGNGRAARIYRGTKDRGSPPEKPGPFWVLLGNGGVCTTVAEMYRWDRVLRTERVLSAESKRKIFTPYINDYGYGWDVIRTPRGTIKHAHNGGSDLGLSAEFQRYVEEDGVFILASNATIGRALAIETMVAPLSRLVFFEADTQQIPPQLRDIDPERSTDFEGTFELSDGNTFVIWNESGQLLFGASGQDALSSVDDEIKARADDFDALNTLALQVLEATFAGNSEVVQHAFSDDDGDASARALRFAGVFQRWEKQFGKLDRIELMGTAPVAQYADTPIATWIRLHFEKKSRVCRLHWERGKLKSLGGMALPYAFYGPLRLFDENLAYVFQLANGRLVELRLRAGQSGVIQELSVADSTGSIKAYRSPH